MTVHYPPTVTIGSELLPSSWDGSGLAALDEVDIDWGRTELYDDVRPTVFKIRVIDPDGTWATSHDRQGDPVTVTVGSRVMARGRVNNVIVGLERVVNPNTDQLVSVWVAVVTISDVQADLASAIVPGPSAYNPSFDEFGDAYWPSSTNPTTRIASIMDQGASDYVTAIQVPSFSPVYASYSFRQYNFSDNRSLLDLITGMYRMIPLAHVNYNPDTETISLGLPADNPGRNLTYTGGVIEISPNAGFEIPANRLELTSAPEVSSTIANAVDVVQINWIRLKVGAIDNRDFVHMKTQSLTDRFDPAEAGRRILQINTDLFYWEDYAVALADDIVALVDGVNGRFDLPELRFDFRRGTTGDSDLDELLLSVYDQPVSLSFPGSIFASLPNVGSSFQLIGGRLLWHGRRNGSKLEEGWTVDLRVSPTVGTLTPVTLTSYVTNTTAKLNEFDPDIRWSDLVDVTIGAA